MYNLTIENKYGEQLELTNNEDYVITNIDGLDPADAVINTTRNASADGSVFNSSYVDNRFITITLSINSPAEDNRINLFKYFKNKYPCRLYYKNDTRNIFIDGYCQKFIVNYFAKKQVAQITIMCPDPYFREVGEQGTQISSITPLFEFPFSIEEPIEFGRVEPISEQQIINKGDVETGAIFTLTTREGSVVNPIIYFNDSSEYLKLNLTINEGDEVLICTERKKKSITLNSRGLTSNIIGKLASGSTWLELKAGLNLLTATAEQFGQNLNVNIQFDYKYEGV